MAEAAAAAGLRRAPWIPAASAAAITIALAAGAASIAGLAPIDDHQLARMLASGESLEPYVSAELGRFVPLVGQEYALAAAWGGASPRVFYAIAAARIALAGFLLWRCLRMAGAAPVLAGVLWCTVILGLGFANAAFRLQVSEINQLVLALVFAWSALAFHARASTGPRRTGAFVVGVVALLLSLGYKEIAFILPLGFGAAEVLRRRRLGEPVDRLAAAAIALAAAFGLAYGAWHAFHVTGSYAAFQSHSAAQLAYLYLATDPFFVLVVLPLAAFRLVAIARDPARHALFDSFLAGAAAYALACFLLRIHSPYYLLPAYAFGACGVAGIAAAWPTARWRATVALAAAALAANQLPAALSDIQFLRQVAGNHAHFVRAVSAWLAAHPQAGGRSLVFAGVSPASGFEVLVSARTFLQAAGASVDSFRVRGSEPVDVAAIAQAYRPREPGIFAPEAGPPRPGEVAVFNPHQSVPARAAPPAADLVHASSEATALPRWWAMHWARHCAPSPSTCAQRVRDSRRPTGYSAYLVKS